MREQIDAVARMQDFIGQHLYEAITPADLSRAALFSPWYAYRLFTKYVGLTPADYVRRLRLTRSAEALRGGGRRVADVALETGFGSVDGFQRAFKKEFGMNPGVYAEDPTPVYLFTPYAVKFRYLERSKTMESVRSVFLQTVEKPARKVLIKRGIKADEYMSYCEEVGCDIWGLLLGIPQRIGEPVSMWLPAAYRAPGTSEYVQGVEIAADCDAPVPEGLDVIELPAAKYLMFQGEPFEEEDYCEAIEALRTAIDRYDPSFIGYAWDEANPRIQLEPVGARGYIELLPIKAK